MKKIVTIVLVSLLSINASLAQDAVQPGYSTANLVNPQHSMPDLLLESSQLNNFLNENGTGLSTRFKREQRVKLYSLINSAVINKFQNQTLIKPVEQDTVLTNLFSWADGLGVYGGSAIYNNLKDNASAAQSPITKVPSQYQISLINDLLMVSSPDYNWQVTFPYYYMLTAMYDTINQGGNDTQIVSISTGMAKNNDAATGYSQGNLMLLHAKNSEHYNFSRYWLAETGLVSGSRRKKAAIHQSHYTYDANTELHKELVVFKKGTSSFAIFYSATEGSYQTNRPHFLSFINALQVLE